MVSQPELRKFIDDELSLVREFFSRQGSFHPMAVFIKEGHRIICDLPPFNNSIEKDMISMELKRLVRDMMPDTVIMIAEAWSGELDQHGEMPKNRREIVHVQIEFRTGEKYCGDADIIRGPGKPSLGPWTVEDTSRDSGRFVDFFPPKHLH